MARHEEYSTDPQGHEAADRLPAWLEWKARCARGLCTAAHQSALADFAGGRFSTYVQRYAASTGIREAGQITALYPPEDAWHLFETHLCARSAPGGKHYKDWIFARPTAGRHTVLQGIEAGASLVVRDACGIACAPITPRHRACRSKSRSLPTNGTSPRPRRFSWPAPTLSMKQPHGNMRNSPVGMPSRHSRL